MENIPLGILLGLLFGGVDIVPMFKMNLPDKQAAIIGAFVNRFAIGFLIPNALPEIDPIPRGALLGGLLSVPDAVITKVYAPILGIGLVGGLIIGIITRVV
ncbi:hypothetical protein ARNL5_02678 [Anaerolineae bacterium]|nr:hypothetical protein ARNL5_02678 [Anaerolineae bacterium]